MKWRLVAPVLVAAMFLCVAGPVSADQQYACSDNSCTFTVPDSYSQASNDPTQIIFQDSVSGGTFSVFAQDGSMYSSLDDAMNVIVSKASSTDGYQAGSAGVQSLTLAGNPAESVSYMVNNSSGTQVEQAVFASLYQNRLYLLIFSTTPDTEDAFVSSAQGIFSSWQFT